MPSPDTEGRREVQDELAKRVAANAVYLGRSVKLASWADAAAVLETLESLGYEIREATDAA